MRPQLGELRTESVQELDPQIHEEDPQTNKAFGIASDAATFENPRRKPITDKAVLEAFDYLRDDIGILSPDIDAVRTWMIGQRVVDECTQWDVDLEGVLTKVAETLLDKENSVHHHRSESPESPVGYILAVANGVARFRTYDELEYEPRAFWDEVLSGTARDPWLTEDQPRQDDDAAAVA